MNKKIGASGGGEMKVILPKGWTKNLKVSGSGGGSKMTYPKPKKENKGK